MKNVLLLFAVVLLLFPPIFANSTDTEKITVNAVRTNEQVKIDGKLSEPIWLNNGFCFSKFRQRDPVEGAEPTQKTEVMVAYNDDALFVAARMFDSAPDSIVAMVSRRDSDLNSDFFVFFIDSYFDRRSGYYFGISAAGSLSDGVLMNDDWDDDTWDGVWEGKVNIDEQGWTAEMKIPFSQLRFHKKDEYIWGINFLREIKRKNERNYLVFTPKNESGFVSRFGKLVGVKNITPSRHLEILPYIRSKAEFTHPAHGNPFNDGSKITPGLGSDFKFGLGNNLTLDATINPDFGQVEVDPAVVNLSDIETFYREKRPFFIEGSSIFNFGQGGSNTYLSLNWPGPDFFYSRRIGRAPQGSLPDHDYADVPEGVRIVGAAKLSGKLGNSFNVGILNAVTAREFANLDLNGTKSNVEVEPLTYFGIFRGQKEFKDSRHALGFMSTVVSRGFDDPRLQDQLNSGAYNFGIDGWTFFDKNKKWVFTGWLGMSHVTGNETRILNLQENSQHYFQRPDADHVSVDTFATSLTGYAGRFWLNKQKGNVIFNSAIGFINPGFDVNDVGFMWNSDIINSHIIVGYKWVKPRRFTRHAEFHLATARNYDFSGNKTYDVLFQWGFLRFLNYYSLQYFLAYNPETINSRRTRGGPLTINPDGLQTNWFIRSDDRKPLVVGINAGTTNYGSGFGWNFETEIEWKPANSLNLAFSPSFEKDFSKAFWVGAFDDPAATKTFGKRYVFAELDQKTFSAGIRLNWTFTPRLSLQLYAQPLIAVGDYSNFKELARPKSYEFNRFGAGASTFSEETYVADPDGPNGPAEPIELWNPDFNFKSLRGNAVLRWEYLPGSTLYLVWTQRRSDVQNTGEFQFNRSFENLWSLKPDNIFMIKATFWRNL